MKPINQRLVNVESGQQEIKTTQKQIVQAVMETNKTVKQHGDDISQIKQAVLETNEVVQQNSEAITHLTRVQSQQHQIVELLSTRSTEQEAEIKRIK